MQLQGHRRGVIILPIRMKEAVALNTRSVAGGALCVALGIVLPMAFHLTGMGGKVFLPMHIPVFLAGLLFGPRTGLIAGVLSPALSSLLTGMPPIMPPVAQVMLFELGAYGFLSGWIRQRSNSYILPLAAAMFGGRIVAGLVGWGLLPLFGFPGLPVLFPLTVSLVTGLPGIALQILSLPALASLLERSFFPGAKHASATPHHED